MIPALLISLGLIPAAALMSSLFAQVMRRRNVGQAIRAAGPSSHATKSGTPTMGGAVILLLWISAVGLLTIWHPFTARIGFIVASALAFFALGAIDDLIGLTHQRSLGLSVRWKMVLSTLFVVGLYLAFRDVITTPVQIPFATHSITLPGWASFALAWFVFLGTTHGANLADGLDGLAAGLSVIILAGTLIVVPSAENLSLGLPLMGALIGFLWINAHPAGLFLGDAGSYLLGGILAALALSSGLAFLLPLLAGVLVLEAVSVIAQVASRRLFGRRLFRMAPFHHHFESGTGVTQAALIPAPDWPEEKVTMRFWILQILFVGLAIWAARL